ncbi:MAG: hypothetical protein AB8H12_05560 [Lewinella sp.]
MRYLLLLACFTLVLASACNKKVAETTAPDVAVAGPVKTINFGATETMKVGETCKLEKSNTAITFLEVVSDNRCPRGVNCIQAGEAVILMKIDGGSPQKVTIDTDPKTVARLTIDGGTVEMTKLSPYPEARVRIDPAQRMLHFRVLEGKKMR